MKRIFFSILTVYSLSFAGNIEDTCNAYVSILDACDVENQNCEKLGEALENSLLKRNVNLQTAKHFHQQCVKVCDLPEGKYKKIREQIKQACITSLKE
ncbi:MAG: hypothetical protein Q9M89_07190 [Persephonella sp.]|nr:hypothetical protein [Persephonella sp.]